ncbi:MAG: type II toxin-antitoxin system VapC family toxin [Planctomycetia bacterium]|nr:type II toxin-antitoxin system VapC family toxin [Planctomycetia bacterium]
MSAVLADTHAAIWYLVEPDRLSLAARTAFVQATAAGAPIYLSAISLVELTYLTEKGRLLPGTPERVYQALQKNGAAALVLVDLNLSIAAALAQIPRDRIPDMPDRIIAATALVLNVPLVSRDRKIQASSIVTIW